MPRIWPSRHFTVAALLASVLGIAPIVAQQGVSKPGDCNQPLRDPVTRFDLPSGHLTPTKDGCWFFAVFTDRPGFKDGTGLSVLRRNGDRFDEVRALPVSIPRFNGTPSVVDIALTQDEKILVISHGQLSFYDVGLLQSKDGEPLLGHLNSPRIAGSFGVTLTPDGRYVLAAQTGTSAVVMVDLEKIRASAFNDSAVAAVVPTGFQALISVVDSSGQFLFTTTGTKPDVLDVPDAPRVCNGGKETEGAIQVVDLSKAKSTVASTVAFAYPAGCRPQSLALSPDGTRLSATAGGTLSTPTAAADSAVIVFDTQPLRDGKAPQRIGKIPVPQSPVTIVDTGKWLLVGFISIPGQAAQNVLVIDAAKVASGKDAILGYLPTSSMGFVESADRRTLYGSEAVWRTLVVIDPARVTPQPVARDTGDPNKLVDCTQPPAAPVTTVQANGTPLGPVATRNGCWLFAGFVDVPGAPVTSGFTIRRRDGNSFTLAGVFRMPLERGPNKSVPLGLRLTPDDKILMVSNGSQVTFFDVDKLKSNVLDDQAIIGRVGGPGLATSGGLTMTPDGRHAFAAQQQTGAIAVLDVNKARTSGVDSSVLTSVIPTSASATNPLASSDGKYLYVANRFAPDDRPGLPRTCFNGARTEGVIQIIDVELARTSPANATAGFASPAGCAPQNLALSPGGRRLSTTAGGSIEPPSPAADNAIVVFDTRPGSDRNLSQLGRVPMPAAPVLIADTGKWIIVGVSVNGGQSDLIVVDPQKVALGKTAILGKLPVVGQSMELSADQRTLYVARQGGLAIVNLDTVQLEPVRE